MKRLKSRPHKNTLCSPADPGCQECPQALNWLEYRRRSETFIPVRTIFSPIFCAALRTRMADGVITKDFKAPLSRRRGPFLPFWRTKALPRRSSLLPATGCIAHRETRGLGPPVPERNPDVGLPRWHAWRWQIRQKVQRAPSPVEQIGFAIAGPQKATFCGVCASCGRKSLK